MNYKRKLLAVLTLITSLFISAPGIASADYLDQWTVRASGTTEPLNDIAYGNGVFVAVGEGGVILRSTDGSVWTREATKLNISGGLYAITYAAKTFVAVGASGLLLTSQDGVTWTVRLTATVANLYSVTHNGSQFMVAGNHYSVYPLFDGDTISLTSADGASWSVQSTGMTGLWYSAVYANGNYVISGANSGLQCMDIPPFSCVWAAYPAILNSADGLSWTVQDTAEFYYKTVWGNEQFVAVGSNGAVVTSPTASTWTPAYAGTSAYLYGLTYANGTFVAAGDYGTVLSSTDGTAWTPRDTGVSDAIYSVAYGEGTFIAVGYYGLILQSGMDNKNSVMINSGAEYTKTTAVTLTLSSYDELGVTGYFKSNSSTKPALSTTGWVTVAATKAFTKDVAHTLTSGAANKTVYVWYKNASSRISNAASASILYDNVAPTNGMINSLSSDRRIDLFWSGFSDSGSGVGSYRVIFSQTSSPTSCATAKNIYVDTRIPHLDIINGKTYYYRVCAVDNAGNMSTGSTISAKPSESTPPAGSVSILSDAEFTKSTTVTLNLSASDNDAVVAYYKANTSTPPGPSTPWTSLTANTSITSTVSHTLTSGAGAKTAYVWYKDRSGNISDMAQDTILYDNAPPSNGMINTTAGDRRITLSFSGFSDTGSGVTSYKIAYSTSATPSSCASALISTPDASFIHDTLTNNQTYYYRVCAVDGAGNASTGAITSAKPIEHAAPTGSVSILNGATYTKSTSVTLNLAASDSDAVVAYYKANTNTPPTASTVWNAVAATDSLSKTVAHTLTTGVGTKTVYVWYKDRSGNISTVAQDTIIYENTPPTNGAANATAGDRQIALTWSGFSDIGSGIASYKIAYSTSATPSSCASAQFTTVSTSFLHEGLTNNKLYYYRVCAVDGAGNASTGAITSAKPIEHAAPTGSVSILNGATYTKSTSVTLNLAASDSDAVVAYYKANTNTPPTASTVWNAVAATDSLSKTVAHTLTTGVGTKTVYVWYKDRSGNISDMTQDDISYDNVPPVNGLLNATAGDHQAALTWSGFSDTGSGIASYRIAYSTSATPSSCASAQLAASGTSYPHTGLTSAKTYYYRLCAIDGAGNMSTGATRSVVIK